MNLLRRMTLMSASNSVLASRQRGAYTIAVISILGLLTLLVSRSMTTATVDSTRLTNNTHASMESFYAAEEAIAQATVWLETNTPVYNLGVTPIISGTDVVFSLSVGGTTINRTYGTEFWYEEGTNPGDVRIVGRGNGAGGTSSSISQWVRRAELVSGTALEAPLTLAQCLTNTIGTPEVWADPGTGSYTTVKTRSGCSPLPMNTSCGGGPATRPYGNLNCGTGTSMTEQIVEDDSGPGTDIWGDMFPNVSREKLKAMAGSNNVYWYEPGEGPPGGSGVFGTTASPAIMVFEGCPATGTLSGSVTVTGIVFVDPDPSGATGTTCDGNGWGGLIVYGTLAVNGTLEQLNANVEIYSGGVSGFNNSSFAMDVTSMPGTWSDLDVN